VTVAADGRRLAFSRYDVDRGQYETLVVDEAEQPRLLAPFLAVDLKFDAAGEHVLMRGRRQAAVHDAASGVRLIGYDLSESGRRLVDADFAGTGSLGVVTAVPRWSGEGFLHEGIEYVEIPDATESEGSARVTPIDGRSRRIHIAAGPERVFVGMDDRTVVLERESP
jgi:hypothetical protein